MTIMLFQPDYTIKAGESDVHFLFNSFAFKKYCKGKGVELDDLTKRVQKTFITDPKKLEEFSDVKNFTTEDVPEILLAANESYCIYNEVPFTAKEKDAMLWVDALGGFVMGIASCMEIFILLGAKLFNLDPATLYAKVETVEEKKSQVNGEEQQSLKAV